MALIHSKMRTCPRKWGEARPKKEDTAMEQKTTPQASASSRIWERLEAFVREHVQQLIQALLENLAMRERWRLRGVHTSLCSLKVVLK